MTFDVIHNNETHDTQYCHMTYYNLNDSYHLEVGISLRRSLEVTLNLLVLNSPNRDLQKEHEN